MQKTILERLIKASYNEKNELDRNRVFMIANYLKRRDLKEYIKAIKKNEAKNTVVIETSSAGEQIINIAKNLFPGKKIVHKLSPSLLLGIKATDNDMVYEANLAHSLSSLIRNVKSYD